MPQDRIPLFPLGVVLFPGTLLPLHIFEERYKEMIGEAIANNSEFGVVLANEKGLSKVGCTAVVEKVIEKYPDGRRDILTRGRRRFEILFLHEERSFLEATVGAYEDEDFSPADIADREGVMRESAILNILRNDGVAVGPLPDEAHPLLSYLIADDIEEVAFRQRILMARGEAERIKLLLNFLPQYSERLQAEKQMKRLAPLNGYGKHFYKA
ncbi:LON peptidase substrate-binding domain-containing protein [Oscillatoria amoena NRMC-F 0135]|nr:LON peptidase substrate-binding domain-containing protein [Oscillatoria amoena NRMC-F 0135]